MSKKVIIGSQVGDSIEQGTVQIENNQFLHILSCLVVAKVRYLHQ